MLDGLGTSSALPAIADKSSIVSRDASGNFAANQITANLTGNVSGTSGSVSGIVAIANGGTGASTASQGLSNLGGEPLGSAIAMAIALG